MKATICITGTLLTVSLLVFLVSCSSDNMATIETPKKQSVKDETQQGPPMIVRQFGGCKAHQ